MDDKRENFIKDTTLYLERISKTFGSNSALSDVSISIMPGEIHGLLGKNGCGKSTLIKILSGFHAPDKGGVLYVNGEKVSLPIQPGEFSKYGMSFVHQDLGLVNSLTVAENWALGEISLSNNKRLNWKKIKNEAKKVFATYDVEIDPDATVESLGPVQRAMLAILRAVEEIHKNKIAREKRRGLLVLDEPTVFLPKTEVDILFSLVKRVTQEGISVIFVSHDLDEVMELTDTFTVLRDGRNVGDGHTNMFDKNEVIEMILGSKLNLYQTEKTEDEKDKKTQAEILKVTDACGKIVNHIDFSVRKGEVLGITGLVGSGFEEVPYLLYGDVPVGSGEMRFEQKKISLSNYNTTQAVKDKMALIPADRKTMGGVMTLKISENLMMQTYEHYKPKCLKNKQMLKNAKQLVEDYEVHPKDVNLDFGNLSGGNQQKVLLAKWIQESPKLLILHEPTQGIDIGARQSIYRLIEASVQEKGMSVICSSSDYEQLEQICDRVLVLVRGRIVTELVGKDITKERITSLCYETQLTEKGGIAS
ncbi:sugar ABC transporter ATP-binding protein [Eubacterium oxidoreducens]|uniref:Ribose transport system ATP-binding protein n=1 Tax=Eubacterium oxidoreducens TaxID=1732 RepID=A0A1G6C7D9_EUBOX|nr:sugar ABC transporter ATP-binding protein [Eubacterium oxidoreducens]SDB28764.1 ribose transport system ATP-binding protein [Eubacterium oxidoreducens]